jgi:hypothetical protein
MWEWLVRDCMASLLEKGGSRRTLLSSGCARRGIYPNHTNAAQRASTCEGTRLRQNECALGEKVGCEGDWQSDVIVR